MKRLLAETLRSRSWLMDHVVAPSGSPASCQAIFDRAHALADELESADLVGQRGLLLGLVDRVVLGSDTVEIRMRPGLLIEGAANEAAANEAAASSQIVVLRAAASLRRRGPEVRLILDGDGPPEPEPDPALIKALAQAHRWWGDLVARRYATMRDVARAYDTDERYVARVIRLAFLDPDLTRMVIEGRQPPEFTLHRFLGIGDLPHRWPDQMRALVG